MSYLADDAAMRSHFDGQGSLVARDEVPAQERDADTPVGVADSYDRLFQAIRVRSFDALLELAREGLTARDVQNAEHDVAAADLGCEMDKGDVMTALVARTSEALFVTDSVSVIANCGLGNFSIVHLDDDLKISRKNSRWAVFTTPKGVDDLGLAEGSAI